MGRQDALHAGEVVDGANLVTAPRDEAHKDRRSQSYGHWTWPLHWYWPWTLGSGLRQGVRPGGGSGGGELNLLMAEKQHP